MGVERQYPLEFRQEQANYVMSRWKSGASVSIVGVGSAGKTNFLQHLLNVRTREYYLGEHASRFLPVVIDSNLLGPLPSREEGDSDLISMWIGLEIILHRLFINLHPFVGFPQAEIEQLYAAYQSIQSGKPLHISLAVRYIETAFSVIFRNGYRVVLVFDEFDELLRRLPDGFFQLLRSLRDREKRHLSFTALTRSPFKVLVDRYGRDELALEPFLELFSDSTLYLGPYNERDGADMLQSVARRTNAHFSEHQASLLMSASGRYAGLMRAAAVASQDVGADAWMSAETLAEVLIIKNAVRAEAVTLWRGLSRREQHVLRAVAQLSPFVSDSDAEQAVYSLMQKRLLSLNREAQTLSIQPPLFASFVASNPPVE